MRKQRGSYYCKRITSDIQTLEVFYAHTISPLLHCSSCFRRSSAVCGMVSSWYLALIALAGYITVGIIVPLISSGKLKESGVRYRAEFASFNAYFLDSIKGIKDIVLNNAGKKREKEVNDRSDILLRETKKMKHDTTKASATTELCVSLFIIAALAVGIALVANDVLTIGKMIIGVVCKCFGSFGPVIAISALPGNLTQTFANSGDRVLNLLAGRLRCKHPYRAVKDRVLNDLKVTDLSRHLLTDRRRCSEVFVPPPLGRVRLLGIVGESGCGKSTFLKLLLRFWQKNHGEIAYNGVDIDNIDGDSLLDNVTMVSQVTYLFDETIEDNLRIAKPDATQEEIEAACKLASIHDFILTLPDGYKTRVGALGDNLSAGEKQRIGLARAFLRGSELILLDEPTSNVDSINEGIILKALKEQKNKKSIILVSHRESTMAIADIIYRVKDGRMLEC
ncbi:MAG: amino acid ABC transporter ATP-binding/permease protein [Gallintestinimicrobium sp.]